MHRVAPRRLSAVVLILVASLAGCLSGQQAGPADPVTSGPGAGTALRFAEPVLVGQAGSSLGEASIDVGPDGSMLVCSVSTTDVWVSEDGGATWRTVKPFGEVRNGDCDVAVSAAGDWYVVFARWTPAGERDLSVSVSRDRGANWDEYAITPPFDLPKHCPVPPYGGCFAHRPWLQAVGESLYLAYFNIEPATLFFQRSDDGGVSWADPVLVDVDPRVGINGDMAVSDDGRTIHLPLVRGVPAGSGGQRAGIEDELRPWIASYGLASSTDGGSTWTISELADQVEARIGFPSVALAGSGELYFSMYPFNGTLVDMVVSVSGDGGRTWSEASPIATGVDLRPGLAYVALDPSPASGVLAAWNGWVDGEEPAGWVVRVAQLDARAGSLVQSVVDATEPAGHEGTLEFFELRHDAQGRVHIAYPVPDAACQGGTNRDCIYHVVGSGSGAR